MTLEAGAPGFGATRRHAVYKGRLFLDLRLGRNLSATVGVMLGILTALGCSDQSKDSEQPVTRSTPGASQALCRLVGPLANNEGVYGTDLGYTVPDPRQSDTLRVLFGDTWGEAGDACRYAPETSDDLLGFMPRQLPPQMATMQASGGAQNCGVLSYELEDPDDVRSWSRSRLYPSNVARAEPDSEIPQGFLRTPAAVFSTATDEYAIFHRNDPVICSSTADCTGAFTCSVDLPDVQIGTCAPLAMGPEGGATDFCRSDDDCMGTACQLEQHLCMTQQPFVVQGLETPVSPPWYLQDPRLGVTRAMYIAKRVPDSLGDYVIAVRYETNRFVNVVARTVAKFDPEHPEANDYGPGDDTLLVWGRPAFVASGGAQSLPFLMYQKLPQGQELDEDRWDPRYFAGYDEAGVPQWSADEAAAQPLYGAHPTLQQSKGGTEWVWEHPEFDFVNQMSLTWLPELEEWIMLYGGDVPDFMLSGDSEERPEPTYPQPVPGAIHVRVAAHPWGGLGVERQGAWTEPVPLLTPAQAAPYMVCDEDEAKAAQMPGCVPPDEGDPHNSWDLLSTLADHAADLSADAFFDVSGQCLEGQVTTAVQDAVAGMAGRLYGVNIIEAWTQPVPAEGDSPAGADVYWNVSTWNPYQVVLVRSRFLRD